MAAGMVAEKKTLQSVIQTELYDGKCEVREWACFSVQIMRRTIVHLEHCMTSFAQFRCNSPNIRRQEGETRLKKLPQLSWQKTLTRGVVSGTGQQR
jgi:hypothetical protein